ncbi:MAG: hypothetical protein K9I85_15665 [Saprospiraceae bacterium]|nr:hypothetical protein [Saprospiraceae bacterium]
MTDNAAKKVDRRDLVKDPQYRIRMFVGGAILVLIGAIHYFRVGSYLNGNNYLFYYSYASDLLLPFGAYFFLVMNEMQYPILRPWTVKAWTVFGLMTAIELLQFFGVFIVGTTFDPLDILVFGISVALAVWADTGILPKALPDWEIPEG